MDNHPVVFLVTPSEVRLRPQLEGVRQWTRTDLHHARTSHLPPEFDFLVTGAVAGDVAGEILRQALDPADRSTIRLLPLSTYEWLADADNLPRRLLALLPGIGRGVLMVVPARYRLELREPPQDCDVRDTLAAFSRREFPVQVVASAAAVAAPVHCFEPPRLRPAARGSHAGIRPQFDRRWLNEIEGSGPATTALRAGVAQIHDLLDESHTLAQSQEGHPDADYWHAIMHRREPDYGNSKYWFRHVGRHPVFAQLAPRAAAILSDAPANVRSQWANRLKLDSGWDPFAFVDLCAAANDDEYSELAMTARRIQWVEMLLLLRHCGRGL